MGFRFNAMIHEHLLYHKHNGTYNHNSTARISFFEGGQFMNSHSYHHAFGHNFDCFNVPPKHLIPHQLKFGFLVLKFDGRKKQTFYTLAWELLNKRYHNILRDYVHWYDDNA